MNRKTVEAKKVAVRAMNVNPVLVAVEAAVAQAVEEAVHLLPVQVEAVEVKYLVLQQMQLTEKFSRLQVLDFTLTHF